MSQLFNQLLIVLMNMSDRINTALYTYLNCVKLDYLIQLFIKIYIFPDRQYFA
jgi:hypothetical protein